MRVAATRKRCTRITIFAAGEPGTRDARTDGMRIDREVNRYILGVLLAFLALNAFAGGYYAITGAEDVPVEWLHGSAFSTYFVPGLVLLVVVGGSAALAAIAQFLNRDRSFALAKLAGWILVIWMLAQLATIGFVSMLQPAVILLAIVILSLAYRPEGLGVGLRAQPR
jgi:hypothetical protein